MSSLGIAALVLATAWLVLRRRHEQRRLPEILESVSGRAVLLFSRTGELRALGPRARAVLGLEGRVDPITAQDLPLEGLDGWILAALAPPLLDAARPGPILLHATRGQALRVDAELVPLRPRVGRLPAWVSLAVERAPRGEGEVAREPVCAAPADGVPAEASREAGAAGGGRLHGVRVLLAEDSADNQRLVTHLLEREGASITVAANGAEAIDLAGGTTFDAVLLDMEMPVLSGWDAAEPLRELAAPAPIIALTAHEGDEYAERCRAAGCSHFLTKPIRRAELIDLLAGLCAAATQRALPPEVSPEVPPQITPELSIETSFEDDPEYQALIAEFVADLATRLEAMQSAIERADWDELESLAHKLKGAAGGFGLPEITEVSAELERSARAGDAASSAVFDRLSGLVNAALR